jgi:hypothetical protein
MEENPTPQHIQDTIFEQEVEMYYSLTDELEYRILHLGTIAMKIILSPEEMIKLKEWIDANQATYCYELLESFDEVIEAMQLTSTDTIEHLRDELELVVNDI